MYTLKWLTLQNRNLTLIKNIIEEMPFDRAPGQVLNTSLLDEKLEEKQ